MDATWTTSRGDYWWWVGICGSGAFYALLQQSLHHPHSHPRSSRDFISLRLLALILCSNCSKTFNKVLLPPGNNLLNYFLQLGVPLQLAE